MLFSLQLHLREYTHTHTHKIRVHFKITILNVNKQNKHRIYATAIKTNNLQPYDNGHVHSSRDSYNICNTTNEVFHNTAQPVIQSDYNSNAKNFHNKASKNKQNEIVQKTKESAVLKANRVFNEKKLVETITAEGNNILTNLVLTPTLGKMSQ